jgi:hypothetical protein
MNPFACVDVGEQIELFAAGECDAATEAAVRTHLAACSSCARSEAEARKLLELLDLRLQEPERLNRLLGKIDEEAHPQPVLSLPRRRRTAPLPARRWLALAASVLLPVGLIAIMMPRPADKPEDDQLQLALGPSPDRSVRGKDVVAPAMEKLMTAQTSAVKTLQFEAAFDGKSPEQFRKALLEAAQSNKPLPPPEVELLLLIHNPSKKEMRLRFDDPRAELNLRLTGPGVIRLPATANPFGKAAELIIPAGATRGVPIPRLVEGSRDRAKFLYWTEPGTYRLVPILRVPVQIDVETRLTTIRGAATTIDVK